MSDAPADPRCPECSEPIGQTATYCMHCSADLTAEREAADADEDGAWDQTESGSTATRTASSTDAERAGQLLAPDGFVDDTLTVLVGIVGGIIVGVVGTSVLGLVTGSGWAVLFGVLAWLGATAYLVRCRTVQAAVAKSSYAVAIVLFGVPLIALSPFVSIDGGVGERGGLFFVLLVFVAMPAGVAAAIGWVASRFVPENADG
ncbi:MAG: zinc ribbon domain-containing protein [Halolamina sp.]